MRLGKVIQGQGQVKCKVAPIRLKLGKNKPTCGGSMKQILIAIKVIRGQGQVDFQLAPLRLKLGENKSIHDVSRAYKSGIKSG